MAAVNYIIGDATEPVGDGDKLLVHICQNKGRFGKGFALVLASKWAETAASYRTWFRLGNIFYPNPFRLGEIQTVKIAARPDIVVVNMLAQDGFRSARNPVPLDYAALESCLRKVTEIAVKENRSVHMPRIGTGFAGGRWERIENIINATLIKGGCEAFVYDLPTSP